MAKKKIAVTGASGHVGSAAVRRLKAAGHSVVEVTRSAGVPFEDAAKLTRAFKGADAAFLMIPPDLKAQDPRRRANELGAKLAEAVKAARVPRVVFLSSVNAHLAEGTGLILGLHDMEERLNALDIAELVHLRPAYFMENLLQGAVSVARLGIYSAPLNPELALPMIATDDVGAKAAELLTAEPFQEPRTRGLLGPRNYTMFEAARVLGAAIGKPGLKYAQAPYAAARKASLDLGVSEGVADAYVQMNRHFNETMIRGTETRSAHNTTETTLEKFAREVFVPVYELAVAAMRLREESSA